MAARSPRTTSAAGDRLAQQRICSRLWRLLAAFRQGLKDGGYEEGRNVTIQYRWAEGAFNRLPALAADLVRQKVNVIVTSGLHLAAQEAKSATSTIPIVFMSGNDPIEFGLVKSLSRPDGNLTGVSMVASSLGPKQLGLLRDLVPKATVFALITNPNNPNSKLLVETLQKTSDGLGIRLETLTADGTERDIDAAFEAIAARRAEGLVLANDTVIRSRTDQIVALAARRAIPVVYPFRQYAAAGGLMSYGTSLTHAIREVGIYTAKVLGGAKPSDLPILQPTTFELVINLRTAKALGLAIPSGMIAIADEVIE
jgi:putative ABC transport system substrate-binding protein